MGTIWFRMRSELKWREVDVTSTFITVGELRGLICDKLALDQRTDTVTVVSETDTDPFPDAKQLPRGSRVRVIRTTFEHLERLKTEREDATKQGAEGTAADHAAEGAPEPGKAGEESEDEFGPSVFDIDAQRRYEAKQAAAAREHAQPPTATTAAEPPPDEPGPSVPVGPEAARAPTPPRAASPAESEDVGAARDDSHAVPLEHLLGLSRRQSSGAAVKVEDEPSTAIVPSDGAAAAAGGGSAKSLLEEHPEMFYKCKRFLPQATAELLYQVIGLPRALRRFEWRQFVLSNGGGDPEAAHSDASTSDGGAARRGSRRGAASVQRSPSPRRRSRHRSRSASPRRRYRSRERSSERARHRSDAHHDSTHRRRHRRDSRSLTPHSDEDRHPTRRRRRVSRSQSRSREQRRSREGSAGRRRSRRPSQRRSRSRDRERAPDRWYDKADAMQETPEPTPDSTLPEPVKCVSCAGVERCAWLSPALNAGASDCLGQYAVALRAYACTAASDQQRCYGRSCDGGDTLEKPCRQRLAGKVPRRSRSADSGDRSDSSYEDTDRRGERRSVRQRLQRKSDTPEAVAPVAREIRGRVKDLRRQRVGDSAAVTSPAPKRDRPRGLFAQALSTVARQ